MQRLNLKIGPSYNVLASLAEVLGIKAEGGYLPVPPKLGSGYIEELIFPGDIQLLKVDFKLKNPLEIRTENPLEASFFTLFINLSKDSLSSSVDQQELRLGSEHMSGIVFFHPSETIIRCPAQQHFQFLVIGFTQKTIREYLLPLTDPRFEQLTRPRKNYYLYEDIDIALEQLLLQILRTGSSDPLYRFKIHSLILELLYQVIGKLAGRGPGKYANIRQDDLEKMIQARTYIKANLRTPPTIAVIARRAGLSESKLKKLFRQVFGKSVYQYIQYLRMLEAQRLLSTGRFNLSETANQIGYANLTHFSNAFEKHIGMKPGVYLKQVNR